MTLCHHIYIFMCRSSWTNVKKDINIKGIVINFKEMQISEYADDAIIFLDGKAITTEREPPNIVKIL